MGPRSGRADPLALLGLAQRAGAVARGSQATRRAVEDGHAWLVVLAEDASPVQTKKILKSMARRSLAPRHVPSGVRLGAALGTGPLSAVAVTDASLAQRIGEALDAAVESQSE